MRAVRPIVDGVISDFEVTEEMLAYLIGKAEKMSKKFIRPRVLIGVPTGITNVEIEHYLDICWGFIIQDIPPKKTASLANETVFWDISKHKDDIKCYFKAV